MMMVLLLLGLDDPSVRKAPLLAGWVRRVARVCVDVDVLMLMNCVCMCGSPGFCVLYRASIQAHVYTYVYRATYTNTISKKGKPYAKEEAPIF